MELGAGYRVRYVSGNFGDAHNNPLWDGRYGRIKGTIKSVEWDSGSLPIIVEWDNGSRNGYGKHDLEIADLLEDELFEII